MLIYRRDAFERDANIAAAKEKGLKLEAPKTWEELDALARFFQGRDWDGDGSPDHGIALVLGADAEGLGNATFLARAASLGQHPDHFSFLFDSEKMTPRIDTDPFVEALQAAIAWKASGPPGMEKFDADAARALVPYRQGCPADRSGRAIRDLVSRQAGRRGPAAGLEAGLRSQLPRRGSRRPSSQRAQLPPARWWLADRSPSRTHRDPAMTRRSTSSSIWPAPRAPGASPRRAGVPDAPIPDQPDEPGSARPTTAPDIDSRLWSDAVSRTLLADRVVPGLRIPDADGYLDDLAKGRQAALAGEAPRKALEGVARAWAERTKARGPKRQLWHYRRSLNLRATSPEPPQPGT